MINEFFNIFIGQISEIFGPEIGFAIGRAISLNLVGVIAILLKFLGI